MSRAGKGLNGPKATFPPQPSSLRIYFETFLGLAGLSQKGFLCLNIA